ncbi:DUF2752 domain-containing protein [Mucilaginibacter auburnensis]|uniref:Uncharacterized protein DUF2752 n=1 Tax=Mucilaginibacter auburnensis TaxID=1457233 RepID=A0A2H9VR56_9SPHI|nr:DUF2752 domain-containing protein [Mucilaginibacter auburnensis]PJJ83283.1 uncharacterized protein DUF2752 [Mucilaginibacter auburnensis]
MIKKLFSKYFELVFWIAALIALATCDPAQPSHFTLCPFKLLGISWCPGCGIGHAIAFLFKGEVAQSINAHWFGIPALGIIAWRIFTLSREAIRPRQLLFQ